MSYQKVPNNEPDIEAPYSTPTSKRPNLVSSILNTSIKILTCTLLILCCTALIISLSTTSPSSLLPHGCHNNDGGFTIPRAYGTKTQYMSLAHSYDSYWTSELSDHNALITLSIRPDGSEQHGAISMFHQLHCLSSIRMALQRASNGEDIGMDWNDDLHWPHCLHHLRETILCFADDTVEQGIVVNGTRTNAIDGALDVRVCRDPRPLYERRRRDGVKEFKGAEYSLDW